MNRFDAVRELVKDHSLRVTDIAIKTGYNKGHVSRLRKEAKGKNMIENKSAKTPADGPVAWGCQCGRAYTVTCISSKPAKQWVSLTDQEVWGAIDDVLEGGGWLDVARTLEQAFREKNT
jgi:hypothetical protein